MAMAYITSSLSVVQFHAERHDVTLTTELIDDIDIADVLDKQSPFVMNKQMADADWVKQPVTTADCQHFFVGEDNKWVLLFKIFQNSPE